MTTTEQPTPDTTDEYLLDEIIETTATGEPGWTDAIEVAVTGDGIQLDLNSASAAWLTAEQATELMLTLAAAVRALQAA